MPLEVESQHRWQMNAMWNKWNLSLNICTVFHAWQLLQKLESLRQVFTLSSSTVWGNKKFVDSAFHMCSTLIKERCVFIFPAPICSIGEMKAMHSLIAFWWLMRHACIHLTITWNDRVLNGMPQHHQGRKLHGAVRVLWNGPVLDHPLTVGTMVNGQDDCALLQEKISPAVCCKQPELQEYGVSLLQHSAIPHCHCDVQNWAQYWGWDVLVPSSYSPDLAPCDYWLFACVKERLWGKWFESEDDINTAVTSSLHHLSKNEYRAAIDHLLHRWQKFVNSPCV